VLNLNLSGLPLLPKSLRKTHNVELLIKPENLTKERILDLNSIPEFKSLTPDLCDLL
jgi:hypothetical protein